ncbi:Nitrilase family, member 2 [Seminavis robusta]|uniref:Nitrilase family, member 2 n=1 Tax=Seminavis robusta TaxID=568900 RepID=A0A9N8HD38_9STRA|nr:Nitrilase family, member 2 [Seminavis robusta]|eukprot:Sro244_g097240.1 Nitrilase family, member 2 (357) ;mRNA; f:62357-63521
MMQKSEEESPVKIAFDTEAKKTSGGNDDNNTDTKMEATKTKSEETEKHMKQINTLAEKGKSNLDIQREKGLKTGFAPGPLDVICARGSAARRHAGNVRFIAIVDSHLAEYKQAKNKLEKSIIVSSVVSSIREASPDGGFVKKDANGVWIEAGDYAAREKVGQRLRDLIGNRYSSSSRSKKRRRNADTANLIDRVDNIVQRSVDGKALSERVEELMAEGGSEKTDAEVQEIFNKANCELLAKFKQQELAKRQIHDQQLATRQQYEAIQQLTGQGVAQQLDAVETQDHKRSKSTTTGAQPCQGMLSSVSNDIEPLSMDDRLFYEPVKFSNDEEESLVRALSDDEDDDNKSFKGKSAAV